MFADYNNLRQAIDGCDSKYKDFMRIMYLFGVRISELLPKKKGGEAVMGKHFSTVNMDGEDALQLTIPTSWQGGKKRFVVVPLNPKYEEWSKNILDLSEERYNEKIFDIVGRTLQQHVSDSIRDTYWYENGYFKREKGVKKYQKTRMDSIQTKHFKEIREVELILTHKFTPYELKNYFGLKGSLDDNSYFRKLLNRTDIYTNNDIKESIKFFKFIFNPDTSYNKNYMDVQKMIKKRQIKLLPVECIPIDEQVTPAPRKGSESLEHRILKRNAQIILQNKGSKKVTFENANLDVVDFTNKIAVECGKSDSSKLMDLFNNVYQNIPDIEQLWMLDYYGEDKKSNLYKFILNPKES